MLIRNRPPSLWYFCFSSLNELGHSLLTSGTLNFIDIYSTALTVSWWFLALSLRSQLRQSWLDFIYSSWSASPIFIFSAISLWWCLLILHLSLDHAFNFQSNRTRIFAVCLRRDWTLCYCSCWPSTLPEGNVGWRVRHSVFQGNWWNRSLDSEIFSGTDFRIQILASLHI